MLQADTCRGLARELEQAESTRCATTQFSQRFPDLTVDDSYAVQRAWMALKQEQGHHIVGHKIGLTSRAMQIASQINEPDYGALLDSMVHHSGVELDAQRFLVPRVEVELAFVLERPLRASRGASVTLSDVMAATSHVMPALELIDARIEQVCRETQRLRRVTDTVADNAASAGVILGGRAVAPEEVDLRWCGALLARNGVIEESGLAGAVLGHPALGVAWLANKLALHGEVLQAGEIVLAGSFTRPVACAAGDVFEADYGGLGTVQLRFV